MINNKELTNYLVENPGYQKKGVVYLAQKFAIPVGMVKQALHDAKNTDQNFKNYQIPKEYYNDFLHFIKGRKKVIEKTLDKVLPTPYTKGDPNNVIVIGDPHMPFTKEGYLEFCREVQEKYNCGTVINIGDEVDNHYISFHTSDPDGLSGNQEADAAQEMLNQWFKVFPETKVCIGNHTALPFRRAYEMGIPSRFIKPYNDIWNAPKGWQWNTHWELYGVLYTHGTGMSGPKAAITKAVNMRQSVVMGHIHTEAGVLYNASNKDLLFGLQVGCGIDDKTYAMAYAKDFTKKSIIGCGVVLNKGTLPIFIPMPL